MKKCYLLFSLFLLLSVASLGQQAPMGMKYQAVARDLKGEVLADRQITLKITLAGNNGQSWINYYSETHSVQTSQLGLFTLVVGEGAPTEGKFTEVPWNTEDIWMEVAIKDNTGFVTLSNSRLLAVPFAFHAFTANELVGSYVRSTGVPSNVWSLFGNANSNPANDALGTTDNADMVVITKNIERMRVFANGNVAIVRSLGIGANLKVDSNVVLNDKLGSTINNGPFTVARNSPSLLSGTLTVDLATDLNAALNVDGPTDLNSRLNVNNQKPSKLTGTLEVDGVTTLKDTSFVANGKPTILTGSLRVDSNGTLKQKLILDNAALDQDTASLVPNGALQVAGGGGFGGNLTVGGSAKIGGGLSLGNLKVTDTTSSISSSTGALTVAGGVGIGKQLNIDGKAVFNNSVDINAGQGQVKITGGIDGDDQTQAAYPLVVTGVMQGIEIKLTGAAVPDNSNNFITFKSSDNVVRGRIEGQTADELHSDPWYKWDIANLSIDVGLATVDLALSIGELVAAISDFRVCVGLGACVAAPSIGTIIVKTLVMVAKIVQLGQKIVNLVEYITTANNNLGVSYSSSAGDYAEWLPKENSGTKLLPGQVIGVRKGAISLNTAGAERILVVSTNPIVLGNTPEQGRESQFGKVAFLGQVPVRVIGKVTPGDYILASGQQDGRGIAKHPDQISIDDISNIVGIAWSGSDKTDEKAIKVAVGVTANDLKNIVLKLEQKVNAQVAGLNDLRKQVNDNNELLAKLVPGYKTNPLPMEKVDQKVAAPIEPVKTPSVLNDPGRTNDAIEVLKGLSFLEQKTDPTQMKRIREEISQLVGGKIGRPELERYPEMTDALIDKMLEWGTVYMEENGAIDSKAGNIHLLMDKIKADPVFKEYLYGKIKTAYTQKVEEQKLLILQRK